MNIQYHEAAILTRIPRASHRMTLEDAHKHAWALFCSSKADRTLLTRPFIFRFEPFDDRRTLMTIRSDRAFNGADQRVLATSTGDTLILDYSFVPTKRHKRKEWTPANSTWSELGCRTLGRAGLEVSEATFTLLGYWKKLPTYRGPVPVVSLHCTATVTDAHAFASAFLDGIGRRRGYGMGLIRLAPDVSNKHQEAA